MHCTEHHTIRTRLLHTLAAAALSVAGLLPLPVANAQMNPPQARPQAQPPSPTISDEKLNAAAAAIGRPGLLLHDLRRSGARALRRAGVAEDVIMKLGGWRTRSMFSRYNIVDESDLADAQTKLNAAFAEARRTVVPLRRRA